MMMRKVIIANSANSSSIGTVAKNEPFRRRRHTHTHGQPNLLIFARTYNTNAPTFYWHMHTSTENTHTDAHDDCRCTFIVWTPSENGWLHTEFSGSLCMSERIVSDFVYVCVCECVCG